REDLHCGMLQQPPERQVVGQYQEGGPQVVQDENPASVMVLDVVSTAVDVLVNFFKAGEKINIDVYLGVLKEVVKPWMD
ncbi:Uncharacterized protein FKW44_017465, partial [Caligus rogercresseyi]